ncbi:MAG: ABC transporter ATP-binding protein, partial [Rhodococcus sp.]|nr:ABC transporter ATP-binding protein [Rhodococcus sp. (in: high G+C Gram-positive bacteria)]
MVRRFFTYYAPYRRLFLIDFFSAVILGVLELGFPVAVQAFIDRLLPEGNWRVITIAAVALALVYVLNTFLTFVVTYWGHMLGINIETDMRRKAFDHLHKLSFG